MLAGLTKPSVGQIIFDEKEYGTLSDNELTYLRNQKIGYIPQGSSVLSNFTVLDNLKKVQGVKTCNIDGSQLTVISRKNSGNLGKLIETITEAGLEIAALNVDKPTLESVFLTLTGRSLRD
jgi:ABC-type lipoprotein export system ATPase subunit